MNKPILNENRATVNELTYIFDLLLKEGQLSVDEHRELVADAKKNKTIRSV